MDLWDLTKLLLRRWYIALPMLVVSLGTAVLVSSSVEPDYSASGHLQLIPPRGAPAKPGKEPQAVRNPWLDLGFNATGQAAIIRVQEKAVLDELEAQGLTSNIAVTMAYQTPMFSIEAVGHSPEQATRSVQYVMKLLDEEIARSQQQYGVTPDASITTLALDKGENVTTVTSKVKRVVAVAGALGLLITAAGTIAIDAILRRRARRGAEDGAVAPMSGQVEGAAGGPAPPVGTNSGRRSEVSGASDERPAATSARRPARDGGGVGSVFESATAADVDRAGIGAASGRRSSGSDDYRFRPSRGHDPRASARYDNVAEGPGVNPSDATIVLPLAHPRWSRRDEGTKGR
ncbi:hypothetical protein ABZ807_17140 [Micromonospora sp. NPDC047548]|uniref:hypothetical protein n=1 Tax=Micromonospora sp. NPDC047548 TaxID=3155624 RepID=UPI0033C5EC8A